MNLNEISAVSVLAAALALTACGGGGNGNGGFALPAGTGTAPAVTAEASVPGSAFESLDSFVAYMKGLIQASSDSASPLRLGDAVAPTSETADPTGI